MLIWVLEFALLCLSLELIVLATRFQILVPNKESMDTYIPSYECPVVYVDTCSHQY